MITTTLRKLSEYTARGISPKYVETNGLMVLNQKCIRNQKIDFSPARLTDANKKFAPSKKIKLHDILINSTGVGTLGRVAQVSKELNATVDSHITIFRSLDYSKELDIKICKKYIGYALREKEKEIEALGKGATGQTELSKDSVLDNIEIIIPKEFEKQNEIASVLAVYDDLMENNEKRIKILEEMAQLIYTEWFVKFKFPGHENVNLVDSGTEFGMIPEGWEVTNLGGIADIKWGDTSTTKKSYIEKGYNAYSASGLDGKLDHFDYDQDGIVLSAIGANCGITWLAKGKWSCIKNTIRILKKDPGVDIEYLFLLTSQYGYWKRRGAAQPFISQTEANSYNAIKPDSKILKIFNDLIKPLYDETHLLNNANISLSKIRDLLIPQLVTGKRELK